MRTRPPGVRRHPGAGGASERPQGQRGLPPTSNRLFDLSGRTAVVAGGTSGIGRELALGLADAGADVVSIGRRTALIEEVAAEIEGRGRRTLRIPADVTDPAALEQVRESVLRTFGRLDILVCAAGVTKRVPTLEMTEEDWNRIMDTNVTGVLRCC